MTRERQVTEEIARPHKKLSNEKSRATPEDMRLAPAARGSWPSTRAQEKLSQALSGRAHHADFALRHRFSLVKCSLRPRLSCRYAVPAAAE